MLFEVAPKSKSVEVLGELARVLVGTQRIDDGKSGKKAGGLMSKFSLFKKK